MKVTQNSQEANVRNIHFNIVLVEVINGVKFKFDKHISLSKPTNFSGPIFDRFDNEISFNLMATVSARALAEAMENTVAKFAGAEVSTTTVEYWFRDELKRIYSLGVPGGRVRYNHSANPGDISEYVVTIGGKDSCL